MQTLRRKYLLCLLVAGPLLIAVAGVPTLRHRHAVGTVHAHGDEGGHSHSHPHSHPHSHSHSHSHHHPQDGSEGGWHVHLTFFGYEFTIWETPSAGVTASFDSPEPPGGTAAVEHDDRGPASLPAFVTGRSASAGWASLFWFSPGPLPKKIDAPGRGYCLSGVTLADERALSTADAPPTPPPEPA